MLVAPLDATESQGQIGNGFALAGERRVLRIHTIAHGGFALGVAPVGGLYPVDGGRLIIAPAEFPGTRLNGIAVDGQVVDERSVIKHLGFTTGDVEDLAALRE